MSRLTEKVNYGSSWIEESIETDEYIPLNYSTDTTTGKCIDKLGKLEDLEEQISCPLDVVVKSQVSGFYGKTKEDEFCFYNPVEDFIIIDFRLGRIQVALSMDFYNVITFYLSDYQKTWFLRKDKSE